MADIAEILEMASLEMDEVVDSFKHEVNKLRIGSVNIEAAKGIMVDAYGAKTPLYQVATLSAPSAMTLVVTPWDKSLLKNIAEAISEHFAHEVSPSIKSESVYVNFPPITKERQKEYLKIIKDTAEKYRQRLRDVRNDAKSKIETLKKDGDITEDDYYKYIEKLDKMIREHTDSIAEVYETKKESLL